MSQHKNKKSVSPWSQCDKCFINVVNKDIEKHSKDCPPNPDSLSYDFIKDSTLFGTLDIKNNEDIKGVADVNSLVFLSQAAFQLCGFSIGEWGMIEFKSKPPVAKIFWPTTEKSMTHVLMTKGALELIGESPSSNVTVTKMPENIAEAQVINLVVLNAQKSLEIASELIVRLKKSQTDKFLCVGNVVKMFYFGKYLRFRVQNIASSTPDELEDSFNRLSIASSFYKCTEHTKFKLFGSENDSKKESVNLLSKLGGLNKEICEIKHAFTSFFENANSSFKRSNTILLFGHPGTGKTSLVVALAQEFKLNFTQINYCDLYSKNDNADVVLRNIFEETIKTSPAIVLLDELEMLCPVRTQRLTDSEKRVMSTLSSILDEIYSSNKKVFIFATTSKLESIDPSFRRYGRFDREIELNVPNPKNRLEILQKLMFDIPSDLSETDLQEIALNTHGFVGADLISLCSAASTNASKRESNSIAFDDFKKALKSVRPSAMREVQVEVANVRWSDIGGQDNLKLILKQSIEWPLRHPESFIRLGVTPPKGVLMYGPPGCSKTMIAKALATESGLNFLSIKGPELFSKWVGDSEKAVRDVFRKARQVAPSIIFFDEIDALGGERGSGSGASVQERVLAQLLTELDGVTPLEDVTVLAATNRPDRIDKALLRPGRLDRIVYVPLPDEHTREEIFKIKFKKMPVNNVDLKELVGLTKGYSGAEVNAVCHEAAMMALEDDLQAVAIEWKHFTKALTLVTPRTPTSLIDLYEDYSNKKNY